MSNIIYGIGIINNGIIIIVTEILYGTNLSAIHYVKYCYYIPVITYICV